MRVSLKAGIDGLRGNPEAGGWKEVFRHSGTRIAVGTEVSPAPARPLACRTAAYGASHEQ
jgi:hypothetical protein